MTMTHRSTTTTPPPQIYQHRQSTIGESGSTPGKYINRSNINMISICGRDNSLCKKMGTSLSPPPPAPALLPGLAASSTELFIGRGAMMMMMMTLKKIERNTTWKQESSIGWEMIVVVMIFEGQIMILSTQRNIMIIIWCYFTIPLILGAKYILLLRASEELTQIAARTVDRFPRRNTTNVRNYWSKKWYHSKKLVIESLIKTPLEYGASVLWLD